MTTRIVKTFGFEAAHRLPNVPVGHKCGRLHGHSFRVELALVGPVDRDSGFVRDFGEVSGIWKEHMDPVLDHRFLNGVPGLENPTAENIAAFIAARLAPLIPQLETVTVHETCTGRAEVTL